MSPQELQDRVGADKLPTESQDWETIQTVYNFHPLIPEVKGKERFAEIFKLGGMGLIRDMLSTAQEAEKMETVIHQRRAEKERADMALAQALEAYANYKRLYTG